MLLVFPISNSFMVKKRLEIFRIFSASLSKGFNFVTVSLYNVYRYNVHAFLNFRGFDFHDFDFRDFDYRDFDFRDSQFNAVYNSVIFSSPLVLHTTFSNLDLPGFCFHSFFMCPHINSVNQCLV